MHKLPVGMDIRQERMRCCGMTSNVECQVGGSQMNKNLWGGRFQGTADAGFARFNRSFDFDRRLFAADVRASLAHTKGLVAAGVLTDQEAAAITNGLQTILECGQVDPNYFAEV